MVHVIIPKLPLYKQKIYSYLDLGRTRYPKIEVEGMKKFIVIMICMLLAFGGISTIFSIEETASGEELAVPIILTGETTFDIPVELGWNFISIPLVQWNESVLEVLDDHGGDTVLDIAQWYDPLDSVDRWKVYNSAMPPVFWDLLAINNTMGLYVNITDIGSDGVLKINGTLPSTTAIDLWEGDTWGGWNMVGYPALNDSSFTVGDLKAQVPQVAHVEGFTNGSNVTKNTTILADDHIMKKGEGYWINITSNCTWIINSDNITITTYPEEMDIYTNSLTGSEQISFWADDDMDDLSITILNSVTSNYLNQEVWQDDPDWSHFSSFEAQLASGNTTYSIPVSSCDKLIVHILGDSDAPDLDLGIFLDGKDGQPLDGVTQENESVSIGAGWDADEEAYVDNPEDGTYLIKIFGFDVNTEPAHFDMSVDMISNVSGIFSLTGVDTSPLDIYEQRSFNVTWNIPGTYTDGSYHGIVQIGNNATDDIASIPILLELDRTGPTISNLMPAMNDTLENRMPIIGAYLFASNGSQLNIESPTIMLDGVDVTTWSSIDIPDDVSNGGYVAGSIIYTPNIPLANGNHTVSVSVEELAGVLSVRSWSFTVHDAYRPGISHIKEIMASINYITPIQAYIDSHLNPQDVEMYYKGVGDTQFTVVPMKKTGTDSYYAEIPAQTESGSVEYYLKTVDGNGNALTLPATDPDISPYFIEIYDHGAPKITHQPVLFYDGSQLSINATVSDNEGIDNVTLFYRKEGDTGFTSMTMANIGGHIYSALISPGGLVPDNIEYYISATDGSTPVTHPINTSTPHIIQYSSMISKDPLLNDPKHTGGSLRVALQQEPGQINPLVATDENTDNVIDLVYDSLARIDPQTREIIPWIAESWTISGDQMTITLNIRENVTWHNGSYLTASDVKYTYDTYALPYISSVIVMDDNTLNIILNSPNSALFSEALQMPLFPQGFNATSEENGCGPFMLGEKENGVSLQLNVYENYGMGRANVDSIIFTYYPNDPVTYQSHEDELWGSYRASVDLIEGELDFIGWDLRSNETSKMIEMPANSGTYTSLIVNSNTTVFMNQGSDIRYIGFNTQREPMNNSEFRRAVAHCIDKDGLTIFSIGGDLVTTDQILNRFNYPYCNETLEAYRNNVELANNILDSAGFFDRDGDGWRDLPYSPYVSFNITLLGPPVEDITQYVMSLIIMTWLEDIGIDVTLISNTSAINMDYVTADDFDMYYDHLDGSQDPSILYDLGHSTSAMNYANYNDAGMDALLDLMEAEVDPDMRAQYAQDCEGYLASQVPYIPLFNYRVGNAYLTDGFDGWVNTLDGVDNFWSYISVYPLSDQTPTDAPLALHAFINTDGTVNLTWNANDETSVSGYNIYHSDASGGPYTLRGSTDEKTGYTDDEPMNSEDSYYVITAISPESGYSNEATTRSDDTKPPVVWATTPGNGAINVQNLTLIRIIFSEGMNTTSVENAFSWTDGSDHWTMADGDFTWEVDNKSFIFDPANTLAHNTTYTFTANGSVAKDTSGNLLDGNNDTVAGDDHSWSFTTAKDSTRPKVVSVIPADGSVGVSVETSIIIEFDMMMDTSSVEENIDITPPATVSFTWSADNMTLTIIPNSNLTTETPYTIRIENNARNIDHNNLASPYSWSFTTWYDNDEDGIPDDRDDDDDNDGFLDVWEEFMDTDPFDKNDQPTDTDEDGIPDGDKYNTELWMDMDDDDDGVIDALDADPLDPEIGQIVPDDEEPDEDPDDDNNSLIYLLLIIIIILTALVLIKFKPKNKTPGDEGTLHEQDGPDDNPDNDPNSHDVQDDGGMDTSPPEPEGIPEPEPDSAEDIRPPSPPPSE